MSDAFLNKILKPLRIVLKENQPVVCLNEEFGYRNWIWTPNCTCKELERWWKRQHNLGKFYFDPSEIDGGHLHGKFILTKGEIYPKNVNFELKEEYLIYADITTQIYDKLEKSGMAYRAHLFCDTYSWLETPKGVYMHHAGYNIACALEEKDLREQYSDYEKGYKL